MGAGYVFSAYLGLMLWDTVTSGLVCAMIRQIPEGYKHPRGNEETLQETERDQEEQVALGEREDEESTTLQLNTQDKQATVREV